MKLIEGHKYIHTDILGKKWELTYTGPRREIKGCEFEFFIDDKGKGCFFNDSEVNKMEKKDIPWPDPLDRSEIKDSKEKCDQKFKDGIRYFQG